METGFCLAALHAAFRFGQPDIWNSEVDPISWTKKRPFLDGAAG
jgi:hypothetical protein